MNNKFIFRNNINNNVSTSIEFEGNKKIYIVKSTFDKDSFFELEKEYNGYLWYSEFRPIFLQLKKIDNFDYMQLKIEYLDGKKANYKNGLSKNYNRILLVINHYNKITKRNYALSSQYPLHGDLSLDNVIFNKNQVFLIDWQYFTNTETCSGFDILNLIYEQLYFELNNNIFKLNKKTLNNLVNLLNFVFDNSMVDQYFKDDPLQKIRKYINDNNKIIWNNQAYKLPVTKFNNKQVGFIDNYTKTHVN